MTNKLEYGSTAVGALNSEARAAAERADRYAEFWRVYAECLKTAIVEHPDEYQYPVTETHNVVQRMVAAFDKGSYNKDGRAFKATCKQLGIKHTYTAIRAFIDTGARLA